MAVVATDQCTLAVSVDVESVQTWYMQVAASASAPAKPTVADPTSLGWTTAEPGFDAANSKKLYTCQKTTLTDGTFMWGAVQLSSSYTGASTALNTANAAATAASNAEKVATNYITALSGNGIWVTPSDAKPSAQGAATATTSGWHIADAIELFKSGLCYIKAWVENSVAKVRIGLADSTHVLIDDESISMKNGASLSTILQMGGSSEAVDLDGNGQTDPFVSFMPVSNSPYVAGSYSFATGFSQAGGNYSIAMDEAEADGERSFAVGVGASAEGNDSRALGCTARAVGNHSQAIGYNVTARGNYSFAGGLGTQAGDDYLQGVGSFAYGRYLLTGLDDGAVAFGSYNDTSHAPLFSFGNGTSQSSRSNLFEVLQNGNAWFSGEVQDGSGNTLSSKADSSHVHSASDVTSGTFDAARIPSLPISKITDLQTTLDGKAASSHTHSYLPLSGGNLTGNLGVKSVLTLGSNTTAEENGIKLKGGGTRNGWVLRTISAANGDGDAILLGDGGLTIIGAGEAAPNLWDALGASAGTETLHLASDNGVEIHTNCQTIADRQTVAITTNGSIVGPNNHVVKLAGVDSSASDNGVSATTYRYHSFLDESDRYIGWLGTTVATSGNITTTVAARTRNGSANFDNVLSLGVTKGGSRTVSVSDAGVWRTALGLGTAATHAHGDYALASHSHSEYFSDQVNRTANTVLAAPNGSAGHASFRRLAMADLVSSFHHNTSHVNIPVVTTAPTAVNTQNWNYEVYSDGEVHAWGTFMRTVTLTTKLGDGFYWNNQLLYLALPVKAKFIQSVNYSMSLGGSGGAGAYCMPGGSAHSVWSGATFYLPFYIARPISTASQSYWFSVDVWYMKA